MVAKDVGCWPQRRPRPVRLVNCAPLASRTSWPLAAATYYGQLHWPNRANCPKPLTRRRSIDKVW